MSELLDSLIDDGFAKPTTRLRTKDDILADCEE
jgi:hypothetical protein